MSLETKVDELTKLLSKLEARLGEVEKQLASRGTGGAASSDSGSTEKAYVAEWDKLVANTIKPYVDLSNKLGADVQQHAALVEKAVAATRDLLVYASSHKKPTDNAAFGKLLEPLSKAIGDVKEFKEKQRKTTQPNHLAAIAEGASAFGWVAENLPAPFVGDMRGSSEFWSNRILKDFKGKDETHCEWVKHWNTFLKDLQVYVKSYHTTGVAWS